MLFGLFLDPNPSKEELILLFRTLELLFLNICLCATYNKNLRVADIEMATAPGHPLRTDGSLEYDYEVLKTDIGTKHMVKTNIDGVKYVEYIQSMTPEAPGSDDYKSSKKGGGGQLMLQNIRTPVFFHPTSRQWWSRDMDRIRDDIPDFVRLSDEMVLVVVAICDPKSRGRRWPADFDQVGKIRATRANFGPPPLVTYDGQRYYLVFDRHYVLRGETPSKKSPISYSEAKKGFGKGAHRDKTPWTFGHFKYDAGDYDESKKRKCRVNINWDRDSDLDLDHDGEHRDIDASQYKAWRKKMVKKGMKEMYVQDLKATEGDRETALSEDPDENEADGLGSKSSALGLGNDLSSPQLSTKASNPSIPAGVSSLSKRQSHPVSTEDLPPTKKSRSSELVDTRNILDYLQDVEEEPEEPRTKTDAGKKERRLDFFRDQHLIFLDPKLMDIEGQDEARKSVRLRSNELDQDIALGQLLQRECRSQGISLKRDSRHCQTEADKLDQTIETLNQTIHTLKATSSGFRTQITTNNDKFTDLVVGQPIIATIRALLRRSINLGRMGLKVEGKEVQLRATSLWNKMWEEDLFLPESENIIAQLQAEWNDTVLPWPKSRTKRMRPKGDDIPGSPFHRPDDDDADDDNNDNPDRGPRSEPKGRKSKGRFPQAASGGSKGGQRKSRQSTPLESSSEQEDNAEKQQANRQMVQDSGKGHSIS